MEPVRTNIAFALLHDHLFRDHLAMQDLAGQDSLASLISVAVGGPRLDANGAAIIADLAATLTAADARIWPLKIGRLLGSYGSIMSGFGGAFLCIEKSRTIGPWVIGLAAQTLLDLEHHLERSPDEDRASAIDRYLLSVKRLFGFGIPFRPRDERYLRLEQIAQSRGYAKGKYWQLHRELVERIRVVKGLEPNIASGVSTALLDLGFSVAQITPLAIFIMFHLYAAHAVEAAEQASPSYQRIPLELVRYTGPARRALPVALDP